MTRYEILSWLDACGEALRAMGEEASAREVDHLLGWLHPSRTVMPKWIRAAGERNREQLGARLRKLPRLPLHIARARATIAAILCEAA